MPIYQYRSINDQGEILTGKLSAFDELDLDAKVATTGNWLLDAWMEDGSVARAITRSVPWSKVKSQELIEFVFQLATQIDTGATLDDALLHIADEMESPRFRTIVQNLARNIQSGAQLHEAMGLFPEAFSPQMLSVIRAGEMSGHLPEALSEVRRQLEFSQQLVGEVRQATVYPMFIIVSVGLLVLILFSFVIPRFVGILTSLDMALPLATRVVLGISDFAKATWWIWGLALSLLPILISLASRYSPTFGLCLDRFKLKIPIFGELLRMISLSRFTHCLAGLLRTGIPILEALELCQGVAGNRVLSQALTATQRDVARGKRIHEALRQHSVMSNLVIRMVALGESTGRLDEVLDKLASYYNEVIPRRTRRLFSYVEPSMIIFLVAFVGCVAFAIFLPLMSLMKDL